ncbi:MAG: iron-sulfur cluster assembly scaffold protein [Candidatus Diapherotrites archaeon]|nr:iron-sulfur cluster assembly scaffold protein [Candidatus Diapherotrites archaeon]
MNGETLEKEFAGAGMYREHILDHYQHPRNFGALTRCTFSHTELNPVCGDMVSFTLKMDAHGKVEDVRFSGHGCAISMASASLLSDEVKGKTIPQIKHMDKKVILDLLGIPLGPVRLKCAMLSLDTVKNAIKIGEEYGGRK